MLQIQVINRMGMDYRSNRNIIILFVTAFMDDCLLILQPMGYFLNKTNVLERFLFIVIGSIYVLTRIMGSKIRFKEIIMFHI